MRWPTCLFCSLPSEVSEYSTRILNLPNLRHVHLDEEVHQRRKIGGSGKGGKNDVIEVNIQPEDDTDYEKQWTRRMHRAQVTIATSNLHNSLIFDFLVKFRVWGLQLKILTFQEK